MSASSSALARVVAPVLALCILISPLRAAAAEPTGLQNKSTAELKAERPGIGGPIALLSVGGAVFLVGVPFLLAGIASNSICSVSSSGGCPNVGSGLTVTGAVLMVAGGGMALGGGLWLGSRIGERRDYNAELKSRDAAKGEVTVQYGITPLGGGLGLGAVGTF